MARSNKIKTERNEKMILSDKGDVLGYEFAGDQEFYRERFVQCDHCKKLKRGLTYKGKGCEFKKSFMKKGKEVREECTGIFDDYRRLMK